MRHDLIARKLKISCFRVKDLFKTRLTNRKNNSSKGATSVWKSTYPPIIVLKWLKIRTYEKFCVG
jgi:hypothetical protein